MNLTQEEFFDKLKNAPKTGSDELLIEFIDTFGIYAMGDIPEKHRNNKQVIVSLLKNKLTLGTNNWKSFVRNRNIFLGTDYINYKYFKDCFKEAFKQGKWSFVLDYCNKDIVALNADNFSRVETEKNETRDMDTFFNAHKDIITNNYNMMDVMIYADEKFAKHLSPAMQNNLKFIIPLINEKPTLVKYLYPNHPILDNESIMAKAIQIDPSIYFSASDNLKNNPEFVSRVINDNKSAAETLANRFDELNLSIQNIPEINEIHAKQAPKEMPAKSYTNKPTITKDELAFLIEKTKQDYKYVGKTIHSQNPKLMLLLISLDYRTFEYSHQNLRSNLKFVMLAAKTDKRIVAYLPESARNNENVMLNIISANPQCTEFIGDKLKKQKSFIKKIEKIKEKATEDQNPSEKD